MKWIAIKQFLVCDVFELIWIFDIYKKKKNKSSWWLVLVWVCYVPDKSICTVQGRHVTPAAAWINTIDKNCFLQKKIERK